LNTKECYGRLDVTGMWEGACCREPGYNNGGGRGRDNGGYGGGYDGGGYGARGGYDNGGGSGGAVRNGPPQGTSQPAHEQPPSHRPATCRVPPIGHVPQGSGRRATQQWRPFSAKDPLKFGIFQSVAAASVVAPLPLHRHPGGLTEPKVTSDKGGGPRHHEALLPSLTSLAWAKATLQRRGLSPGLSGGTWTHPGRWWRR
jgi:hypothetical protein